MFAPLTKLADICFAESDNGSNDTANSTAILTNICYQLNPLLYPHSNVCKLVPISLGKQILFEKERN